MHSVDPQYCLLPEGRYLVIGDLQSNYDIIPYLIDRPETILFMGDYVDSYGFTRKQQFAGFMYVLDFVERGKAKALYGNHEMSYMGTREMQCTGYSGTMRAKMMPYLSRARKLLSPLFYHERTRTLFTHAGITKSLWDEHDLYFDSVVDTLHTWSARPESPFYSIGVARGGQADVGGPLWCDWDMEFDGVPGLTQVVGHTGLRDDPLLRPGDEMAGCIRMREANLNIDCLGIQPHAVIFDTSDGSFTGVELDKKY